MGDDGVVAGAQQSEVPTDALRILGLIASREENVVLLVLELILSPLQVVGGVDEHHFRAFLVLVPEVLHRFGDVLLIQFLCHQDLLPELEVVCPAIMDADEGHFRGGHAHLESSQGVKPRVLGGQGIPTLYPPTAISFQNSFM